jgi:hypothetical protein
VSLRRTAETRRLDGLLLAAVLITSQASAWVHAGAVAHVTCVEHGEAIHAAAPNQSQSEGRAIPVAVAATVVEDEVAALAAHDHCGSDALLRWRALAIDPPAVSLKRPPLRSAPSFLAGLDAPRLTAIYRSAPKTSPPHAAA